MLWIPPMWRLHSPIFSPKFTVPSAQGKICKDIKIWILNKNIHHLTNYFEGKCLLTELCPSTARTTSRSRRVPTSRRSSAAQAREAHKQQQTMHIFWREKRENFDRPTPNTIYFPEIKNSSPSLTESIWPSHILMHFWCWLFLLNLCKMI